MPAEFASTCRRWTHFRRRKRNGLDFARHPEWLRRRYPSDQSPLPLFPSAFALAAVASRPVSCAGRRLRTVGRRSKCALTGTFRSLPKPFVGTFFSRSGVHAAEYNIDRQNQCFTKAGPVVAEGIGNSTSRNEAMNITFRLSVAASVAGLLALGLGLAAIGFSRRNDRTSSLQLMA